LQIGTEGAVSAHIQKLPDRLAKDRSLRQKVKQIETELTTVWLKQPDV